MPYFFVIHCFKPNIRLAKHQSGDKQINISDNYSLWFYRDDSIKGPLRLVSDYSVYVVG